MASPMTFADLRLPCQHGRYEYHVEPLCKHGKTHMHASSEWACAGPDHCSGGRSATIEDLGLLEQFGVVDAEGNMHRFNGPWTTEAEAQAHVDWIDGERIDRMRAEARVEEEAEQRAGRISTNLVRMALKDAEKQIPHQIVKRLVTRWERIPSGVTAEEE